MGSKKTETKWIALFRGINVGGKNILSMAGLKKSLESLGLANVCTYIQSGNVIFDSETVSPAPLQSKIARQIETDHGLKPAILLMSPEVLKAAVLSNPFPEATSDPKTLHYFFLENTATDPDVAAIDAACADTEEYVLSDHVFYLHAPDGIGRSKLAAKVEKCLGVPVTARNHRTVEKLLAILRE